MFDTHTIHDPHLGALTLSAADGRLVALRFGDQRVDGHPTGNANPAGPLARAVAQLGEYLTGTRRAFDLPLSAIDADADANHTPFQRAVWAALTEIPYGATTTYGGLAATLAARLGRPVGPRAVASAVARTPVPIVLPCHRVIGADGGLRGYVGGLERKRWLLDLESGRPALVPAPPRLRDAGAPRRATSRREPGDRAAVR